MISYREFGIEEIEQVKQIYKSESWMAYLRDDEALKRAFINSIFCLGAYSDEKLIGFVRCVGDGEHIVMVQDLIVVPEYQRQKIGSSLFKMVSEKYSKVRMFQVITDINDERDNMFYKSFGMKPIVEGDMISYFRR